MTRDATELFYDAEGRLVELVIDDVFWPLQGVTVAHGEPIFGTCIEFNGYGDDGHELAGVLFTTQLPDEVAKIVFSAHDNNQMLFIRGFPSDQRHPTIGCRVVAGLIEAHDSLR